jgi:hypothetical protein
VAAEASAAGCGGDVEIGAGVCGACVLVACADAAGAGDEGDAVGAGVAVEPVGAGIAVEPVEAGVAMEAESEAGTGAEPVVGADAEVGGTGAVADAEPFVPEAPSPRSARSASDSSTEDETVLTSIPAALSWASSALPSTPRSLAISCTRFLLIQSILRARDRVSRGTAARARCRGGVRRAAGTPRWALPRRLLPGRDKRRAQGARRQGRSPRAVSAHRYRERRQHATDRTSARSVRSRRSGAGAHGPL